MGDNYVFGKATGGGGWLWEGDEFDKEMRLQEIMNQNKDTGLSDLGGLSGIGSVMGSGAQLYNAYKTGQYHDGMLKEQRRMNNMYLRDAEDRRKARNQLQSNVNDVWGK